MSDELAPLIDQSRRLAMGLEGIVPEVRCLAGTLTALDGGGEAVPLLDLWLPAAECQRLEKVATGLGWKPRRREIADTEVRDLGAPPAPVWVYAPEARERVTSLEQVDRPMRTLLLGERPADAAAEDAGPAKLADPMLPVVAQLRELAANPELGEWRRRQLAARVRAALGWLEQATERQLATVRLRRELLAARLNPKGPGGGIPMPRLGGSGGDATARAKPLLQRQFGELERGLGNTDAAFLGVPAGALIRELEELADALVDLDRHQRANAIATRIPRSFEEDVNRRVRERLFEHFSHDLKAINDLFQLAAHEVERLVESEGGLPVVLDPRLAKDDVISGLLDRLAVYRSTHQGELPRRGFNEYFSQIRKYAMLLMMSASMLGATAVLRSYKEITIPATLVLITVGAFNVFAAAREERAEAEQKDLENARGSVKQEMRRIVTEVQRQWSAALSSLLAAQQQNLLDQMSEAGGRESALRTREKEEEKGRLQVQLSGLIDTEKRLTTARDQIGKTAGALERVSRGEPAAAPAPAAPARPAAALRPVPGAAARAAAAPGAAAAPAAAATAAPAAAEEPAAPKPPNPAQVAAAEARAKLEALRAKMKAGKS